MSAILSFVLGHASLLLALVSYILGLLSPKVSSGAVSAYKRLAKYLKAKIGVDLPDNPQIEAEIAADSSKVLEIVVPILANAAVEGKLDKGTLEAVVAALKAEFGK